MRIILAASVLLFFVFAMCSYGAVASQAVPGAGLGATYGGSPPATYVFVHANIDQSLGLGGLGDAATPGTEYQFAWELCDDSGIYNIYSNAAGINFGLCPIQKVGRAFLDAQTGILIGGLPYPNNYLGESPEREMYVQAGAMFTSLGYNASYQFLSSNTGQGGAAYTTLQKNGTGNAFEAGTFELVAGLNHIPSGSTLVVGAEFQIHGEADCATAIATYQADVTQGCADDQAAFTAITHQTRPIPCLVSQNNARCLNTTNNSGIAQLLASQAASPGGVQLIGGTYQYPRADGSHFTTQGGRMLGDLLGEIYVRDEQWANGKESWWKAMQPITITTGAPGAGWSRAGNVETIQLAVPNGPPVIDTTNGTPHTSGTYVAFAAGYGFEAWLGGFGVTPVAISSLAITQIAGNWYAVLTVSGNYDTIAYAHIGEGAGTTGSTAGRFGCVRDSGPTIGQSTGLPIRHWLTEFVQGGL